MFPKLILFDIDGTLIDTAGAGRRAMKRAFAETLGIGDVSAASSGVAFAGRTDPVILEDVALALGLNAGTYARSAAGLRRAFLDALREEMARPDSRRRTLPGVRELLDRLRADDRIHLGLLTGNLEEGARIKLEAFELNPYFEDGGFASDHPDRREIARTAWSKLSSRTGIRFAPEQVSVIGDTEHDVDCARANGFRAVAVDSGWTSRETLERAAPDALLDDLTGESGVMAALGLDSELP